MCLVLPGIGSSSEARKAENEFAEHSLTVVMRPGYNGYVSSDCFICKWCLIT